MSAGNDSCSGRAELEEDKEASGDAPRATISFTVAVDGEKTRRFRVAPGKRPVKVGRGPKNDVVLSIGGISGHHLDILAVHGAMGQPVLAVRDASTNGTGLLSSPGNPPLRLAKDASVEVLSSSILLVPFNVKPVEGRAASDLRVSLQVCVCDEGSSAVALTGKRASSSASVGDAGPARKQRVVVTGATAKASSSAVVEDMMARCRAFAAEKAREREQVGETPANLLAAALPRLPSVTSASVVPLTMVVQPPLGMTASGMADLPATTFQSGGAFEGLTFGVVGRAAQQPPLPPPPPPHHLHPHPHVMHGGVATAPQGLGLQQQASAAGIHMGMPPFGVPPFGVPAIALQSGMPSTETQAGWGRWQIRC